MSVYKSIKTVVYWNHHHLTIAVMYSHFFYLKGPCILNWLKNRMFSEKMVGIVVFYAFFKASCMKSWTVAVRAEQTTEIRKAEEVLLTLICSARLSTSQQLTAAKSFTLSYWFATEALNVNMVTKLYGRLELPKAMTQFWNGTERHFT